MCTEYALARMKARAYLKSRVEIEGNAFVVEKGRQDLVRHEGRAISFVLPVAIIAYRNAYRHNELRLACRASFPRPILEAIARGGVKNALPTHACLDFGEEMPENRRAIYGLRVGKEAVARIFVVKKAYLELLRPVLFAVVAKFRANGKAHISKMAFQISKRHRKVLEVKPYDYREVSVISGGRVLRV